MYKRQVSEELQDSVCFSCNKKRKKFQGREQILHLVCSKETADNLESIAFELGDIELLKKIQKERANNGIFYHNICKRNFENSLQSKICSERENRDWHETRDIHKKAFEEVCTFVSENIVKKEQSFFLSFLHTIFIDYLKKNDQESSHVEAYHLESRLLKTFPKQINILTVSGKKIVKPYKGVILRSDILKIEKDDILQRAALILRNEIMNIKVKKLPETDLIRGECDIPSPVIEFYSTLLAGKSHRRRRSIHLKRTVEVLSSDVIFAVSNGKIKPSKHISLGITIKSLTNSKKIVNF